MVNKTGGHKVLVFLPHIDQALLQLSRVPHSYSSLCSGHHSKRSIRLSSSLIQLRKDWKSSFWILNIKHVNYYQGGLDDCAQFEGLKMAPDNLGKNGVHPSCSVPEMWRITVNVRCDCGKVGFDDLGVCSESLFHPSSSAYPKMDRGGSSLSIADFFECTTPTYIIIFSLKCPHIHL